MSAYQEYEGIKFTDLDCLVEAIVSLEEGAGSHWSRDQIIVDSSGEIPLYGYQQDNRNVKYKKGDPNYAPLAEVCIPGSGNRSKQNIVGGASNDIGFCRAEDGSLVPIISGYDSTTYNECWMNGLKAKYLEVVVTRRAKKQGYKVKKKKVGGKVRMTLSRWR